MKSHIRKSKASGSAKRKIEDIVHGRGQYSPKRLEARWMATHGGNWQGT